MTLTDDMKQAIQAEYTQWESQLWAGKDLKSRQAKGQFATPPELVFKMLEKFDTLESKDVLDPCLGAGNLIAGAIFAGADPKRCFGIELDPDVLQVAKRRLAMLGVPPCNLVEGDALDPSSYEEKLKPFKSKAFAIVTKKDGNEIELIVVKDKDNMKKVSYSDRIKLKDMLDKLVKKNVPVFKV